MAEEVKEFVDKIALEREETRNRFKERTRSIIDADKMDKVTLTEAMLSVDDDFETIWSQNEDLVTENKRLKDESDSAHKLIKQLYNEREVNYPKRFKEEEETVEEVYEAPDNEDILKIYREERKK